METEFLVYLENLKYYAEQHNKTLFLESRNTVAEAEQGKLRKLIAIFRDFPLEYSIVKPEARGTFCAVLTSKYQRWMRNYTALLKEGNFEISTHEASKIITVNAATQSNIQKFHMDIIINACVTLLDSKNQLKPAIINFFGLHNLLAQHESHPAGVKKIIYCMIYSFWLEIVTVNLGLNAIRQDCDIRQLEALNGYSKEMLRHEKLFTPFFIDSVKNYNENFSQTELAACLQHLPADRVTGKLSISVQHADHVEDSK
ncbi:MAG: hypothetical protein V4501_06035 [Pseudomonadota bacterium]